MPDICRKCLQPPRPGRRLCQACADNASTYQARYYARCLSAGLCVNCAKTPAADGKKWCVGCFAKLKENPRYVARLKDKRTAVTDTQEKPMPTTQATPARSTVKCTHCPQPARPGRTLCRSCNEDRRRYEVERYAHFKAAGLCAHCGKRRPTVGTTKCRKCRQTANASRREHKETPAFATPAVTCMRCHERNAEAGLKHCRPCLDEAAIRNARRDRSKKATAPPVAQTITQERYERRLKTGTCILCGKVSANPGLTSCFGCQEAFKVGRLVISQRQQSEQRAAQPTPFISCYECHERPARPGLKSCQPCANKDRARKIARIARRRAAGLCEDCGKVSPLPGLLACAACREYDNRRRRPHDATVHKAPAQVYATATMDSDYARARTIAANIMAHGAYVPPPTVPKETPVPTPHDSTPAPLVAPHFEAVDHANPLLPENLAKLEMSASQAINALRNLNRVAREPERDASYPLILRSLIGLRAAYRELVCTAEARYEKQLRLRDRMALLDMTAVGNILAADEADGLLQEAWTSWRNTYAILGQITAACGNHDAVFGGPPTCLPSPPSKPECP